MPVCGNEPPLIIQIKTGHKPDAVEKKTIFSILFTFQIKIPLNKYCIGFT